MKAPISWLQDFVKIDIPAEALADKLVHAGFEVEEIIREADAIKNVVTGRVLAMERHPNSDHLWICQINVKTATLQIVTGAQNVQVGDIVPVALDGAVLPGGKRIFNGELRGVKSLGMLCSGSELGLTDADYEGADVDGILILKPDTKVGVDINEILGRTDVILDVSVTANRPDFQILFYPVISMLKGVTHSGSRQNLIGETPSAELEQKYSLERQVSPKKPQAFIMLSADDAGVLPINGIGYFLALQEQKVPATLHVYPTGGHGWGFRDSFTYKRQWTGELEKWLREGLPFPEK